MSIDQYFSYNNDEKSLQTKHLVGKKVLLGWAY